MFITNTYKALWVGIYIQQHSCMDIKDKENFVYMQCHHQCCTKKANPAVSGLQDVGCGLTMMFTQSQGKVASSNCQVDTVFWCANI